MLDALTLAADDWSLESFENRLGDRLDVDSPNTIRTTHLDTFDWLLHESGCRLTHERTGAKASLHWHTPLRPYPYVLPITRMPRFARDLPEGFLRSELEAVTGPRALLVAGAARVLRRNARVSDNQNNTLVRLLIEEVTVLDASSRPVGEPHRTVTAQPVGAGGRTYRRVLRILHECGASDSDAIDPLNAAAEARGRRPGGYSSKLRLAIRQDQPCGEALRKILDHLRHTTAANVEGVIDDVDVEFLHDLRVACRRARSALSQLKGAVPGTAADNLATELRWLGEVTNPCRDLDVHLLDMTGYRRQLGAAAGAIDDLEKLLRRERSKAFRRVRGALRSQRFAGMMDAWAALAEGQATGSDSPNSDRPISEVAGKKILKAYRRMVKHGMRLANPPPAEDLHRLRIDAKKLRYLLEFFGGLYPAKTTSRLVKELKQFQDILGETHDMAVQQEHLAGFAETLMAEGSARADTMFAMGRLADAMSARQSASTEAFATRFDVFANQKSRKLYQKIFGGG
jgi:CHAD domain-containing protein